MKCYCNEADKSLLFCIENVENVKLENAIQQAGWKRNGNRFSLLCPHYKNSNACDKELISGNFSRLGQAMFQSMLSDFDWEIPLQLLAQKFAEQRVEWYLIGSVSDIARGIVVKPHDIDIVVHTKDFHKVRDICYTDFSESVILPFLDDQKLCPLRCFGRLFLAGVLVEIAADEKWNFENRQQKYEKLVWNGYDLYVEALSLRYQIEISRNRKDRIKAFNEYKNQIEQS